MEKTILLIKKIVLVVAGKSVTADVDSAQLTWHRVLRTSCFYQIGNYQLAVAPQRWAPQPKSFIYLFIFLFGYKSLFLRCKRQRKFLDRNLWAMGHPSDTQLNGVNHGVQSHKRDSKIESVTSSVSFINVRRKQMDPPFTRKNKLKVLFFFFNKRFLKKNMLFSSASGIAHALRGEGLNGIVHWTLVYVSRNAPGRR